MFNYFLGRSTVQKALHCELDPRALLTDQETVLCVRPGQLLLMPARKKGGGSSASDPAMGTFHAAALQVVQRELSKEAQAEVKRTGALPGMKGGSKVEPYNYFFRVVSSADAMVDAFAVPSEDESGSRPSSTLTTVVCGAMLGASKVCWNMVAESTTPSGQQQTYNFVQWDDEFAVHSKDGWLVSNHSKERRLGGSVDDRPLMSVRFAFKEKADAADVQGLTSLATYCTFAGLKDGHKKMAVKAMEVQQAQMKRTAAATSAQAQEEEENDEEDAEEEDDWDAVDDAAILGGYGDVNYGEADDMPGPIPAALAAGVGRQRSVSVTAPQGGAKLLCFAQQATYGKALVVGEGTRSGAGCTIRATHYTQSNQHASMGAGVQSLDISRSDLFAPGTNGGGVEMEIDDILCNAHHDTNKVLLHNQGDTNAVYELDLEHGGKRVAAYDPGLGYQIDQISHHYDASTGKEDPNLVCCLGGVNRPVVAFTLDKRMGGQAQTDRGCAVVETTEHLTQYQQASNHFSCIATSPKGYLAIGDVKGAIRLFTGPPGTQKPASEGKGCYPKASKTLIPGNPTAGPVLHLDISNDSKFIVATYGAHIVVMSTEGKQKNESGRGFTNVDGFQKSLNNKKSGFTFNVQPLQLTLDREQVAYIRNTSQSPSLEFAKAVFDNAQDDEADVPTTIVATVGGSGFLATWHMSDVAKGLKKKTAVLAQLVQVGANNQSKVQQVAAIAGMRSGGGGGDDLEGGAIKDLLCLTDDSLECTSVNVVSSFLPSWNKF